MFELSERERIVVRKALEAFMEQPLPVLANRKVERSIQCAEREIARDLALRV